MKRTICWASRNYAGKLNVARGDEKGAIQAVKNWVKTQHGEEATWTEIQSHFEGGEIQITLK